MALAHSYRHASVGDHPGGSTGCKRLTPSWPQPMVDGLGVCARIEPHCLMGICLQPLARARSAVQLKKTLGWSNAMHRLLAAGTVCLALLSVGVTAQTPQPYAGMETRPIKALSEQQIADLRTGRGMSLALAAELNGYTGSDQGHRPARGN